MITWPFTHQEYPIQDFVKTAHSNRSKYFLDGIGLVFYICMAQLILICDLAKMARMKYFGKTAYITLQDRGCLEKFKVPNPGREWAMMKAFSKKK